MSNVVLIVVAAVVVLGIVLLAAALKIVKHYERGVLFRLGRLHGTRQPGLNVVIPVADVLVTVSLRRAVGQHTLTSAWPRRIASTTTSGRSWTVRRPSGAST